VRTVGDMIKNGRRGTLSGKLRSKGVQGTSPIRTCANPIHAARRRSPSWSRRSGTAAMPTFPATSWQVSNIHAGTGAGNVIPGELVVDFNFRFCTESTPRSLQDRVESILRRHGLDFRIDWTLGGEPFLTPTGALSDALADSIRAVHRRHHRAVDDRRHVGRPLHREGLPRSDRARPGQRDDPQDRRVGRGREPRSAEGHLPRRPRAPRRMTASRSVVLTRAPPLFPRIGQHPSPR
jgi:hypothetical protein